MNELNNWHNDLFIKTVTWVIEWLSEKFKWLTPNISHLFSFWMNKHFWLNLLNKWCKDSHLFCYLNQLSWINWLSEWFKLLTHKDWINQSFWMTVLNKWSNDLFTHIHTHTHTHTHTYIYIYIQLFLFLTESVFLHKLVEWIIQTIHSWWQSHVQFLNESSFLNKSVEWMIQMTHWDSLVATISHFIHQTDLSCWIGCFWLK